MIRRKELYRCACDQSGPNRFLNTNYFCRDGDFLMDLFKRFPKVLLPRNEQDLIPENQKSSFADFAADFAILERELMPTYRELDREAVQRQNSYRWMYVILIFGGSLATILGIIQLTVDG